MKNVFRAIAALLLTTCVLYLITLTAAKVRILCHMSKFPWQNLHFTIIMPIFAPSKYKDYI